MHGIKAVLTRFLIIIILLGIAIFTYPIIGFFGLSVLGLLAGVITLGVEQTITLYHQDIANKESMSATERTARHAEIESAVVPLLVAKIISAGLIIGGLGLFFVVHLGA